MSIHFNLKYLIYIIYYYYHWAIKFTSGSIELAITELQNVVFGFCVVLLLCINESGFTSIPIKEPMLCLGLQADTLR